MEIEERLTIKFQLNDTVSFKDHFQLPKNLKNSKNVKYNSYELKKKIIPENFFSSFERLPSSGKNH